jgi:hypothetical protein
VSSMALLGTKDEARSLFSVLKVEIRIYDDDTSLSRKLQVERQHSSLDSEFAELGVVVFLLGSGSLVVDLGLGEGSSGGTGTSGSEVVRGVSGVLERVSGGSASHLTEDGEDLSDVLADGTDSGHLDLGGGGDLGDSEGSEFFLYRWKNYDCSVKYSKVHKVGDTYSLEVKLFDAVLLGFASKFVGLDSVHFVDNN